MKKMTALGLLVLASAVVPTVSADQALAQSKGCLNCHSIEKAIVGPAYKDVAKKYAGQNVTDQLAQKVMKGGGGVWGSMSMKVPDAERLPGPKVPFSSLVFSPQLPSVRVGVCFLFCRWDRATSRSFRRYFHQRKSPAKIPLGLPIRYPRGCSECQPDWNSGRTRPWFLCCRSLQRHRLPLNPHSIGLHGLRAPVCDCASCERSHIGE